MKTKRYVQICAFLLTLSFSGRCGAVDTCTTYVKLFKYPVTNALLLSNIAVSPDGKYFAESQSECTLRMLSLLSNDNSIFIGANDWINAIVFSPDGKHLLTGAGGPTYAVRLWNIATGTIEKTFTGNKGNIFCSVACSPDGKSVAAADNDSSIFIWNKESGEIQRTIHAFGYTAHSLKFSSDSRFILATFGNLLREERTARIWDIASGQCVRTFSGHTGYVESADFSHDGKYIITASYDKTACLWDLTTGDSIRTFKGHTSAVASARFSPDDRTVLTASSDATSRLWNVGTGEQIRIFTIRGDNNCEIVSAEFMPDGKSILTGSKCKAALWKTDGTSSGLYHSPTVTRHSPVTLRVQNRRELYITLDQMYTAGNIFDLIRPDGRVLASATPAYSEKTTGTICLEHAPPSGFYLWRVTNTHTRAVIGTGSAVIQ